MPRGRGRPEEAPRLLGACADPDSAVSLGSAAFCSEHCAAIATLGGARWRSGGVQRGRSGAIA